VQTDEFAERLIRVRNRFASALTGKIEDSFAAIPKLSSDDNASIEAIVVTHRRLHEMCGIAPTLGFEATGKAARAAESVVRVPAKTRRPLTPDEVESFKSELVGLRAAAQSELQSIDNSGMN